MKRKHLSILLISVLLAACTNLSASSPFVAEDLSLSFDRTDLRAFAISPNGEIYAIPLNGTLTQFTYDGEEISAYPNTEMFYVIHAHEQYIYAYDESQHRFAKLNPANGEITTIGDEIIPTEIKNIVVTSDTLYALLILPREDEHTHGQELHVNADGYMDFEEQLFAINIKTGKMTNTGIDHIIAIYAGSNNTLYYYAYIDDRYGLYSYVKGKSTQVSEMNEVGYLATFAYENDEFVYLSASNPSIWSRNMSNGQARIIYDNFYILTAGDMQHYAGNIVLMQAFVYGEIETEIKSFNISNPFSNSTESLKVTVSTANPGLLRTGTIQEISDTSISYKMQPESPLSRLTEFMAGEPDVDVYLGYSTGIETLSMFSTFHVPLNGSEAIKSYLDNCFDYISDAAHSPDGDIWMLPLYGYAEVLWYVPENLDRFNVSPDDMRYFDGFVEIIKRINEDRTLYAAYVDYPMLLMDNLTYQYEMTYNDYTAKKVDYNTELFTRIFTTIFEGYPKSGEAHPIFGLTSWQEGDQQVPFWTLPNYDKSRAVFKYGFGWHMNDIDEYGIHMEDTDSPFDGWRVMPAPRVSKDVKGNAVYLQYAVINPLSKNKAAAMKLLETIAANPFETIRERHFLIKDPEAYRDYYDISQLGFHDLLRVFEDGMVVIGGYPGDLKYTYQYIDDYRSGRLTAEEAILVLQREVEMWLNE